jgi:hypothetical protein
MARGLNRCAGLQEVVAQAWIWITRARVRPEAPPLAEGPRFEMRYQCVDRL